MSAESHEKPPSGEFYSDDLDIQEKVSRFTLREMEEYVAELTAAADDDSMSQAKSFIKAARKRLKKENPKLEAAFLFEGEAEILVHGREDEM